MNEQIKWLRPYVSIGSALAFLILAVSGTALFMAPSCKVAREIEWNFLFSCKESWEAIHVTFAYIFLILGIVHLALNWKPLISHLKRSAETSTLINRPAIICVIITLTLLIMSALSIPPVSWLYRTHESIKSSWGPPHQDNGNQRSYNFPKGKRRFSR